jgi:ligand-binding sensor domain-containing protein
MRSRLQAVLPLLLIATVTLRAVTMWLDARRKARMEREIEAMMHGPIVERRARCTVSCSTGLMRETCAEVCHQVLTVQPSAPFEEGWRRCLGACIWTGEGGRDACARACVAEVVAGRDFHYTPDGAAPVPDGGALSPWVAMIADEAIRRGPAPDDDVAALLVAGDALWAADRLALYRSDDGGAHFSGHAFEPATMTAFDVRALASAGGALWVGTAQGLLRSTDGGARFARVPGVGSVIALVADGDALLVGSLDGVQRVEGGRAGPTASLGDSEVDALGRAPDGTLLATTPDAMWRSRDGRAWRRAAIDSALPAVVAIAVDGETVLAGSEIGAQLHRSRDHGARWLPVAASGLAGRLTALVAAPAALYAATRSDGVYASRDHGRTWSALDDGLDSEAARCVTALAVDRAGVPWAATRAGLRHFDGTKWIPLSR